MVATDFVDSYEWKDGRAFDWNEVIPGFNEISGYHYIIPATSIRSTGSHVECHRHTEISTDTTDILNCKDHF